MLYVESEERTFLATYSLDDRHAEPQAVGSRDKKRRDLDYPAMRTLCCTLSESRTVIVSPSAILTTMPSRKLAAEEEDDMEKSRSSAKSRERRDRRLSIINLARHGKGDYGGMEMI
jgi:hypothetical protein